MRKSIKKLSINPHSLKLSLEGVGDKVNKLRVEGLATEINVNVIHRLDRTSLIQSLPSNRIISKYLFFKITIEFALVNLNNLQ